MLTAAQQATRSRGIGGSEISAVSGLDPYRSPLDVWLRKTGQEPERETTEHMLRGTHLGPALAAWYEAKTGKSVTHRGAHERTLVCAEHPLVVATPDGIVHRSTRDSLAERVLECKSPHWRSAHLWGQPGTDEVPEHYLPQVTWEMAAAELHLSDVAALLDGELRIYTVGFDNELFAALYEAAERFWRDHVLTGKAPPVDGSESAREWLLRQHPRATADVIQGTEREAELLRQLQTVKSSLKDLEAKEESIRQALMERVGDHEGLVCDAGKISWRCNKGTMKTDYEAIVREITVPDELIQKHTRERPGPRVFRVTFAK